MAAGLTIPEENIQLFESAFYGLAEKGLSPEDLAPEISLDSYVLLAQLNEKIIAEMDVLAPFGMANPEPLLGARDANIVKSEVVSKNHLKLKIRQQLTGDPAMWDGIAYGMGAIHPVKGNNFDIAFVPYIDEWNGIRSLKLKVKEIKQATNC